MAQSDVAALLPLISPYALPADPSGNLLYTIANDRTTKDIVSGEDSEITLAQTYYVAHLLYCGAGKAGISSEKIDDYAISFKSVGASGYLDLYNSAVADANSGGLTNADVGLSDGVTRTDELTELEILNLDATSVIDEESGEEFV